MAKAAEPAPVLAPALATAVPVPPEAVPAAPAAPDAFDAAFSEAVAAENAEPKPAPRPPKPKPAEPAEPAQAAEPPRPAPEPVEEPADEPEPPPAPAPPVSAPMPLPPLPALAPQPPPQLQQPQADPPMFTAEEATQLQTFYNDWPDVAKAAEIMVQGMLKQTVRNMYRDMASTLAPYFHTIDTLADRSQLSELQGQVSDYDAIAGNLTAWAARQPMYLRSAYEHVIKSGTAAEVVDLINRYKQDTQPAHGAAPGAQPASAAAATVAPAAAAPAPSPVSPALATAAARLAPVSTKRTNVVAPPADFDTAFAEFARAS